MSDHRSRILAIDDTPSNLMTLGTALAQKFVVQIATSGEQGLALAREFPPDLILLDVMMPGMDGYEVCRQLRLDPVLHSVPVIFITALSDIESEAKGLSLGACDYITKPINVDIARQRIDNLLERETYFKFFNSAAELMGIMDTAGVLLKINPAFAQALGQEATDVIGQPLTRFIHAEDWQGLQQALLSSTRGDSHRCEARLLTPEGQVCWMAWRTHSHPRQSVIYCSGRDIQARKAAEDQLKLAAGVFTHSREGIIITDADGVIVEVNNAFARITGYSRDEVIGHKPKILRSGKHPPDFYSAMWDSLINEGFWSGEVCNRRKDGDLYPEMLTISAVLDGQDKVKNYIGLLTDITALKAQQEQLEQIAHFDPLTGLPNRVLLGQRLHHAIVQSQSHHRPLAVVYLDLDGFKAVNDHHGHDIGDLLLIALARRMESALREGDTLSRIGGDEFIALLEHLDDPRDHEHVLGRLLEAASHPVAIGAITLHVSASIGLTIYPQDLAEADLLIRHADQAMYQAKQAGKNRYHLFDAARDAAIQAQVETLEHIRQGLEQNEFVLFYQPKVNLKTGQLIGAEALIRWQHPERGLLPPGAFLPMLEDHPLSIELGEWVIQTALAQISEWRAAALDIPISVNMGALQLQQPDFVQRLASLLASQPDVPPSRLELEVLETSALHDMDQVSDVMLTCLNMGVQFALDDFGTGYSSLLYLKRLPASTLKIDQSFVRDILDDPEDLAIIKGVVGLGQAFNRTVIAEGVESSSHGIELLRQGCFLAQGYGIARPMPAQEMPHWANTWRLSSEWQP